MGTFIMRAGLAPILAATLFYFGIVFAVAFGLGVLRVLLIAPLLGPVMAVLLEVPVILGVAWVTAGRALRRWPVMGASAARLLVMGGLAFGLLMLAEAALALAIGTGIADWVRSLATAEGALGLAAQAVFGVVPLMRGRLSPQITPPAAPARPDGQRNSPPPASPHR